MSYSDGDFASGKSCASGSEISDLAGGEPAFIEESEEGDSSLLAGFEEVLNASDVDIYQVAGILQTALRDRFPEQLFTREYLEHVLYSDPDSLARRREILQAIAAHDHPSNLTIREPRLNLGGDPSRFPRNELPERLGNMFFSADGQDPLLQTGNMVDTSGNPQDGRNQTGNHGYPVGWEECPMDPTTNRVQDPDAHMLYEIRDHPTVRGLLMRRLRTPETQLVAGGQPLTEFKAIDEDDIGEAPAALAAQEQKNDFDKPPTGFIPAMYIIRKNNVDRPSGQYKSYNFPQQTVDTPYPVAHNIATSQASGDPIKAAIGEALQEAQAKGRNNRLFAYPDFKTNDKPLTDDLQKYCRLAKPEYKYFADYQRIALKMHGRLLGVCTEGGMVAYLLNLLEPAAIRALKLKFWARSVHDIDHAVARSIFPTVETWLRKLRTIMAGGERGHHFLEAMKLIGLKPKPGEGLFAHQMAFERMVNECNESCAESINNQCAVKVELTKINELRERIIEGMKNNPNAEHLVNDEELYISCPQCGQDNRTRPGDNEYISYLTTAPQYRPLCREGHAPVVAPTTWYMKSYLDRTGIFRDLPRDGTQAARFGQFPCPLKPDIALLVQDKWSFTVKDGQVVTLIECPLSRPFVARPLEAISRELMSMIFLKNAPLQPNERKKLVFEGDVWNYSFVRKFVSNRDAAEKFDGLFDKNKNGVNPVTSINHATGELGNEQMDSDEDAGTTLRNVFKAQRGRLERTRREIGNNRDWTLVEYIYFGMSMRSDPRTASYAEEAIDALRKTHTNGKPEAFGGFPKSRFNNNSSVHKMLGDFRNKGKRGGFKVGLVEAGEEFEEEFGAPPLGGLSAQPVSEKPSGYQARSKQTSNERQKSAMARFTKTGNPSTKGSKGGGKKGDNKGGNKKKFVDNRPPGTKINGPCWVCGEHGHRGSDCHTIKNVNLSEMLGIVSEADQRREQGELDYDPDMFKEESVTLINRVAIQAYRVNAESKPDGEPEDERAEEEGEEDEESELEDEQPGEEDGVVGGFHAGIVPEVADEDDLDEVSKRCYPRCPKSINQKQNENVVWCDGMFAQWNSNFSKFSEQKHDENVVWNEEMEKPSWDIMLEPCVRYRCDKMLIQKCEERNMGHIICQGVRDFVACYENLHSMYEEKEESQMDPTGSRVTEDYHDSQLDAAHYWDAVDDLDDVVLNDGTDAVNGTPTTHTTHIETRIPEWRKAMCPLRVGPTCQLTQVWSTTRQKWRTKRWKPDQVTGRHPRTISTRAACYHSPAWWDAELAYASTDEHGTTVLPTMLFVNFANGDNTKAHPATKDNPYGMAPGEVILDTGAAATLGGKKYVKRFIDEAKRLGLGKARILKSDTIYRYAGGASEKASKKCQIPINNKHFRGSIGVDLIAGDTPILFGLPQMAEMNMKLDPANRAVWIGETRYPARRIADGTMVINLLERSVEPDQQKDNEEKPFFALNVFSVLAKYPELGVESTVLDRIIDDWKAMGKHLGGTLPPEKRIEFCNELHKMLGHNKAKVINMLHAAGYAKEIIDCYKEICNNCTACQIHERQGIRPKVSVDNYSRGLLDLVSMDLTFVDGFKEGEKEVVFHILDHFSQYSFVEVLGSKEAIEILDAFEDFATQGGSYPCQVKADHGREFVNDGFWEMCETNGIEFRDPIPYCPVYDAKVERHHTMMKGGIAKTIFGIKGAGGAIPTFRSVLKRVARAKDALPTSYMGMSPNQMWHTGNPFRVNIPGAFILDGVTGMIPTHDTKCQYLKDAQLVGAMTHRVLAKLQTQRIFDEAITPRNFRETHTFEEGDEVWVMNETKEKTEYKGCVTRMIGNSVVCVWARGNEHEVPSDRVVNVSEGRRKAGDHLENLLNVPVAEQDTAGGIVIDSEEKAAVIKDLMSKGKGKVQQDPDHEDDDMMDQDEDYVKKHVKPMQRDGGKVLGKEKPSKGESTEQGKPSANSEGVNSWSEWGSNSEFGVPSKFTKLVFQNHAPRKFVHIAAGKVFKQAPAGTTEQKVGLHFNAESKRNNGKPVHASKGNKALRKEHHELLREAHDCLVNNPPYMDVNSIKLSKGKRKNYLLDHNTADQAVMIFDKHGNSRLCVVRKGFNNDRENINLLCSRDEVDLVLAMGIAHDDRLHCQYRDIHDKIEEGQHYIYCHKCERQRRVSPCLNMRYAENGAPKFECSHLSNCSCQIATSDHLKLEYLHNQSPPRVLTEAMQKKLQYTPAPKIDDVDDFLGLGRAEKLVCFAAHPMYMASQYATRDRTKAAKQIPAKIKKIKRDPENPDMVMFDREGKQNVTKTTKGELVEMLREQYDALTTFEFAKKYEAHLYRQVITDRLRSGPKMEVNRGFYVTAENEIGTAPLEELEPIAKSEDVEYTFVSEINAHIPVFQLKATKSIHLVAKELTWEQVSQCKIDPYFVGADAREMQSFIDNNCFELVDDPRLQRPGQKHNFVRFRWVRTYKHEDPNDPTRITRTKSRLVYKGFSDGRLDYGLLTDAPTVQTQSLRCMIPIGMQMGWTPRTFDISTAFLRGDSMAGTVYSDIPDGLEAVWPGGIPKGKALRLKSCVYGLGDAPREWYLRLKEDMLDLGFEVSKLDPSIFLKFKESSTLNQRRKLEKLLDEKTTSAGGRTEHRNVEELDDIDRILEGFITIHVDDGLAMGNLEWQNEHLQGVLNEYDIEANSVGQGNFKYLGGVMRYDEQKHELIIDFTSFGSKLSLIKIDNQVSDDEPLGKQEHSEFRSNLGIASFYTQMGHPLSSFEINRVSTAAASPTARDARELNRIVRKIQETPMVIRFVKLENPFILAMSDASFNDMLGGRSQAGKIIGFASETGEGLAETDLRVNIVGWKSHSLKRVVHSTRAAETISAIGCVDLAELTQFLYKECTGQTLEIRLLTDCRSMQANLAAIVPPKEKGLMLTVHELKQFILRGNLVQHVRTESMVADCLTKEKAYLANPLMLAGMGNEIVNCRNLASGRRKYRGGAGSQWTAKARNTLQHDVITKDMVAHARRACKDLLSVLKATLKTDVVGDHTEKESEYREWEYHHDSISAATHREPDEYVSQEECCKIVGHDDEIYLVDPGGISHLIDIPFERGPKIGVRCVREIAGSWHLDW